MNDKYTGQFYAIIARLSLVCNVLQFPGMILNVILLAAGIMMFSIITFITSFKDNCVITLWPLFILFPPSYKYHPF